MVVRILFDYQTLYHEFGDISFISYLCTHYETIY